VAHRRCRITGSHSIDKPTSSFVKMKIKSDIIEHKLKKMKRYVFGVNTSKYLHEYPTQNSVRN
jgi:hypothetical protein